MIEILSQLWERVSFSLSVGWEIVKIWWWFWLPCVLWKPFKYFYFWWVRWEVWYKKRKWVVLEVRPPRENVKPFKAMEDVITTFWGIYGGPNWREIHLEGVPPTVAGTWISFEIASFGGEIHFYLRVPSGLKDFIEANLYAHYPDLEISVVEDYTKKVPQNIPNQEWDLMGDDFSLLKKDCYPIKTYSYFFEERPEVAREEKRIDPFNALIEALSKFQEGEQFWLQIVACPITNNEFPWIDMGREEIKKLGEEVSKKWAASPKKKTFGEETKDILWKEIVLGKEEKPPSPPSLPTPWPPPELVREEEEKIKAIQNKIKKHGWKVWIRSLYLCQKTKPHFFGNWLIGRQYFHHFGTENLNGIVFWGPTRCKIHYWFPRRRLYVRKRKMFQNYVERMPSTFPRSMEGELSRFHLGPKGPGIRGVVILNSEELATIYHFPAKILSPNVVAVEAKKAAPPSALPKEE